MASCGSVSCALAYANADVGRHAKGFLYCCRYHGAVCKPAVNTSRGSLMHRQVEIALADPVLDPQRRIVSEFFWMPERLISAGLTCNIGME